MASILISSVFCYLLIILSIVMPKCVSFAVIDTYVQPVTCFKISSGYIDQSCSVFFVFSLKKSKTTAVFVLEVLVDTGCSFTAGSGSKTQDKLLRGLSFWLATRSEPKSWRAVENSTEGQNSALCSDNCARTKVLLGCGRFNLKEGTELFWGWFSDFILE